MLHGGRSSDMQPADMPKKTHSVAELQAALSGLAAPSKQSLLESLNENGVSIQLMQLRCTSWVA